MQATTTTITIPVPPDKLRQVSTCPKCGAPIYIDAELGAEVLDQLPTPWFTCNCRWTTVAQQTFPIYPIPTWPSEPTPPVNPWPGPTWVVPTVPSPFIPNNGTGWTFTVPCTSVAGPARTTDTGFSDNLNRT